MLFALNSPFARSMCFSMDESGTACLVNFLGKGLASACHGDYIIDGKPDLRDFGPLQLEFTDHTCLVFDLVSDGQSVASATKH